MVVFRDDMVETYALDTSGFAACKVMPCTNLGELVAEITRECWYNTNILHLVYS